MGRLVVFEGIDGSGKSTQFKKLCDRLEAEGRDFRKLVFPQYAEPSSAPLRMYLAGEFGQHPEDVNAYAASTFFAVDRFASYKKVWKDYYNCGGLVMADRYTTSNAVHQASKLPIDERKDFFRWLTDFEYRLLGLPAPDVVIYMDLPLDTAIQQIRKREEATDTKGDIHETDTEYLKKCHECAASAAEYYGWTKIKCTEDGKMRSIEDIHNDICGLLKGML